MAAGDGKTIVFPLPWSAHFSGTFKNHWTQRAQAEREARKSACLALRRVAPTLTVPPGHIAYVEYVFIRPYLGTLSKKRLIAHMQAMREGFADCLGCHVWHFNESHRVAKVPTPGGEVLVKLRIAPIKGGCEIP
jgi:hypothetical protein